jgi:hypothetical protein
VKLVATDAVAVAIALLLLRTRVCLAVITSKAVLV